MTVNSRPLYRLSYRGVLNVKNYAIASQLLSIYVPFSEMKKYNRHYNC